MSDSVWDGAPEWANEAWVQWRNGGHAMWREKPYRRIEKTIAREIAEKTWDKISHYRGDTTAIQDIENAINEALRGAK